jgi:hypothetical protein
MRNEKRPISWLKIYDRNTVRHPKPLKHLQAETSAELDALLPAILDRAFNGEL